jgi:hypothetical protein
MHFTVPIPFMMWLAAAAVKAASHMEKSPLDNHNTVIAVHSVPIQLLHNIVLSHYYRHDSTPHDNITV